MNIKNDNKILNPRDLATCQKPRKKGGSTLSIFRGNQPSSRDGQNY